MLQPLLRADDIIWVHDYHLIPFAAELRKHGISNPIGFFLHIPFPPWQTFMAIPEHQELARMLTAYDLIGLQTRADVANLVDYMSNGVFGRIVPDGRIRVFEQLVSIASFPVGIDMTDFAKAKRAGSLVQARPSVSRIVGVDRLDYTMGLPQKFKAFGRLLDKYPHYQRQVVLTQIAPPTRESVEGYSDIRHELESLAGSINGRLGELDWVPIHFMYRSAPRRTLGDVYRSSRVCMVTPLRDGMNLIAKEYVAAQDSADPGVLILSKFAGAAEEMTEALIVNPYSIEETADAIRAALEMTLAQSAASAMARYWRRYRSTMLRRGPSRSSNASSGCVPARRRDPGCQCVTPPNTLRVGGRPTGNAMRQYGHAPRKVVVKMEVGRGDSGPPTGQLPGKTLIAFRPERRCTDGLAVPPWGGEGLPRTQSVPNKPSQLYCGLVLRLRDQRVSAVSMPQRARHVIV